MDELKGGFRPEFLNRLDEIIIFKPLTKDNIVNIVDIIISDLNKRLEDRQIKIELTSSAKDYVIKNGYDANFGARPLKRYIQSTVENMVARSIMENKIGEGDNVVIDEQNGSLTISK